jgi:putative phage-type endonuclease
MNQGSEEWLKWRQKGIGASDASVIMGVDPYRTIDELFLDKTGRGTPIKQNPAMKLGNQFEEAARALLYLEFFTEFEPITLSHPNFDFIKASLDGYSDERSEIAEIKYMGEKNFLNIKESGKPLEHHYPQMQQQLFVKAVGTCIYVPYTLTKDKKQIDQIQFVPIYRNDAYIELELLPRLKQFWGDVQEWIKENQPEGH